jgi:hypothetical protein
MTLRWELVTWGSLTPGDRSRALCAVELTSFLPGRIGPPGQRYSRCAGHHTVPDYGVLQIRELLLILPALSCADPPKASPSRSPVQASVSFNLGKSRDQGVTPPAELAHSL